MDRSLVSGRWDEEYRRGRYVGKPPVEFVKNIMRELGRRGMSRGTGLYVGCGNGRNYIPLIDAGLNLHGIDVSNEAIRWLSETRPCIAHKLSCQSMDELEDRALYDYLVAIQVFQHGRASEVANYFKAAGRLLKAGGMLFVRVNSAGTDVYHSHKVIEHSGDGGFTVRYSSGPKAGLDVHFFSSGGLVRILKSNGFKIAGGPSEIYAERGAPMTGSWAQFEVVAEKGGHQLWRNHQE